MQQITKKQFAKNSLWKIMEQFSAKGISMMVSIVLARLLLPSDYGLLALTTVFTNLSDILIDGGFGTALIRKKEVDEYDYSAVFAVSSTMSIFLYLLLYFFAPAIANYYDEAQLITVLRVVGLTFFLQSFTSVQNGIVNRNMQFKLLFSCNTVASIASGIIGIVSAYAGFGVWALVLQRLTQQGILTIMLLTRVGWKVQWRFEFARIREMFSFSIGVVGASLLNYLGSNIYSAAIGKKYSVTDLGYYDKGSQLPMQFSLYTFGAMSSVLLPTISSCQSDLERVKRIIRRVVGMTSFLIMPLMAGVASISKELIVLLFTDKWLQSISLMRFACLYYAATPYMLICVQVFFALGYSKLRVKTEVIRLVLMAVGLGFFGFVLNCTMNQLALVSAVIACIVSIISYLEVRKLIHYYINEVLADMWKPVVGSVIMGAVIYTFEKFATIDAEIMSLLFKSVIGIVVYTALVFILKMPEKNDLLGLIRREKTHE